MTDLYILLLCIIYPSLCSSYWRCQSVNEECLLDLHWNGTDRGNDSLCPLQIKEKPTELLCFDTLAIRTQDSTMSTKAMMYLSDTDYLLGEAVATIVKKELSECHLIIVFDTALENSVALHQMVLLPNPKQLVRISMIEDYSNILWGSSKCSAYILVLETPERFLTYLDDIAQPWNYQGKYILVGLSKYDLDIVASSRKGKKTEHIVGLVKDEGNDWKVYMNQLYLGEIFVIVNRWRPQRFFTSDAKFFPDKTSDLQRAELKMVTFEFKPHVIKNKGTEDSFSGRDIQIAEILSEALNFSLIVNEAPQDEYWGYKTENGTWNGMTGVLERNEAHFGLAFFFLTNNDDMIDILEYSRFYDSDMSCFMARVQPPLPRWQSLAAPFQMETWLAIFVGLLFFCPLLSLFARASFQKTEHRDFQRLSSSTLYTLGIHFREPQYLMPHRASARTWVVFLWIYTIILTTGYSSNLTAFLTIERPRASMETVKELHKSNLDVLAVGYFFKVSLQESGNNYLKVLAERFQGLPTFGDSFDPVSGGRAVILETRTYLEYLIASNYTRKGVPSMRIMKECYAPYNIAIPMQKYSPLKKSFDKVLGWLFDNGILQQWFTEMLGGSMKASSDQSEQMGNAKEGDDDQSSKNKDSISLSIAHLQGIFYVHLLGLALSSLLFLSEMCCFDDTRNRKI